MVWYSRLLKNLPHFFVIHTVKGFSVTNEAEVDVLFLEFSCLFYDPTDIGSLISGSSALLNPACIKYVYDSLKNGNIIISDNSQNVPKNRLGRKIK